MPEYYFRLPNFNELNELQNQAVIDENAIALSGGAGTGKSVVSIYRHILNHSREIPINSQLITFTKSLAHYLTRCCRSQNVSASNHIDSSLNWMQNCDRKECDEIIHDEAQDLALFFNESLQQFAPRVSYGADNNQLIRGNCRYPDGTYNLAMCSPEENLRPLYPNNSLHRLPINYRNSKRLLRFARLLLPEAAITNETIDRCPTEGIYPRLIIATNLTQLNQTILDIVNQFAVNEATNIAILVPFENANQLAGETATVRYYYNLLTQNNIECSRYTNGMPGQLRINNIHITTFKSAKGLEFDVVIVPDFHLFNTQFRVINWNDYYVGITRTKSNLFLISAQDFPHIPDLEPNKLIDKVQL